MLASVCLANIPVRKHFGAKRSTERGLNVRLTWAWLT